VRPQKTPSCGLTVNTVDHNLRHMICIPAVTMGIVRLTSPQVARIFGWFDYHPLLSWPDVQNNTRITFKFLLQCGVTTVQLFRLQHNPSEWVQHGGLQLDDCLEMTQWPIHPVRHMRADLADVLQIRWTSDQMLRVGLTLPDLLNLGMTPTVMSKFGFTLHCWVALGLRRLHINEWTDQELHCVFKMTRHQIYASCV
jgi:hypothetical protein